MGQIFTGKRKLKMEENPMHSVDLKFGLPRLYFQALNYFLEESPNASSENIEDGTLSDFGRDQNSLERSNEDYEEQSGGSSQHNPSGPISSNPHSLGPPSIIGVQEPLYATSNKGMVHDWEGHNQNQGKLLFSSSFVENIQNNSSDQLIDFGEDYVYRKASKKVKRNNS